MLDNKIQFYLNQILYKKYIFYKNKYLTLKQLIGGHCEFCKGAACLGCNKTTSVSVPDSGAASAIVSKKNEPNKSPDIARMLHTLLETKNYIDIQKLIDENGGNIAIIDSKNKGMISNLLRFIIETDSADLKEIITYIENKRDFSLMKRDYLKFAQYYYSKDIAYSINIFKRIIEKNMMFLSKDIDYILENKMYVLLPLLNGLFITSGISLDSLDSTNDYSKLQLKFLEVSDTELLLRLIIKQIETDYEEQYGKKRNINDIISHKQVDHDITTIIDAGNVIYDRFRRIDQNSLTDLVNIILETNKTIGKPLIVIHNRHKLTLPGLKEMLESLGFPYFFTIPKINDDLFILYFFLTLQSRVNIITNDKYRDHIAKYKIAESNSLSQFENIIEQQIVNYNMKSSTMNTPSQFSKCIQHIDDTIYIPHNSGRLVRIKLPSDLHTGVVTPVAVEKLPPDVHTIVATTAADAVLPPD